MRDTSINTSILSSYVINRNKALLGDKIAERKARIIYSSLSKNEKLIWLSAKVQCQGNENRALDMLKNPSKVFDNVIEYR